MDDPLETAELLAFAKAVEMKSLSRAAVVLAVPRATLGRRLARLEQRLGARLLKRTTRSLTLTDAGDALYRHARTVLDAVAQAEASVRRGDDRVRGDLRVSIPPNAGPGLRAMLTGFAKRYPDVRLTVHVSSEIVDLRGGRTDVAIRASSEHHEGLIARTLARDPVIAVASPAYLAEKGTPRTARQLRDHRCLLGFLRGEAPQTRWPLLGGGKLPVDGVFSSNDATLLAAAAASGLGIAMVPHLVVAPYLESGDVVQVLADVLGTEARIAVVYAERELLPPAVRAFVDAVIASGPTELLRVEPVRRRKKKSAEARRRRR